MGGQRVGMKPGEAFKIRLLPREIMACAAIARQVAPEVQNLSLAQAVRIAITELCEAAIKAGVIPEPDPFEYVDAVSGYRRGSLSRKVQAGRAMLSEQMARVSAGGQAAFGGLSIARSEPEALVITEEERRVRAAAAKRGEDPVAAFSEHRMKRDRVGGRMAELAQKANTDPANMTPSEFKELKQLRAQAARSPSAA